MKAIRTGYQTVTSTPGTVQIVINFFIVLSSCFYFLFFRKTGKNNDYLYSVLSDGLRTVPTNTEVFLRARAIRIQKENWG